MKGFGARDEATPMTSKQKWFDAILGWSHNVEVMGGASFRQALASSNSKKGLSPSCQTFLGMDINYENSVEQWQDLWGAGGRGDSTLLF